jgi:lipoprotein NlpI
VIGLFLAAQAAGQDPVAATSEFLPQSTQPAWPYPVLQVLHGQLSESALQEQLKNGGKPDYTKVTEASYALGQFELQKGNKAQAKAWFQKAMFGMQMEMPELYFSDRQIEALK